MSEFSKEELEEIRADVRSAILYFDNETLLELLGVFSREKERRIKEERLQI